MAPPADSHPGPPKWAVSAQGRGSISVVSCSGGPVMPAPTMLRKARTRVVDGSMIVSRKRSKSLKPLLPVSTAVVTPQLRQ